MKKRAVYVVGMIMAVAVILLVPIGIFREEQISHNGAEVGEKIVLEENVPITQWFVPAFDYIRAIAIAVDCKSEDVPEGVLCFRLYDEKDKILYSHEYKIEDISNKGFFDIPVKRAVSVHKSYRWEIAVTGTGEISPELLCTAAGRISPPENGTLIVNGEETECTALNMYTYGARQGKLAAINYIAFVLWAVVSFMAYLQRRGIA